MDDIGRIAYEAYRSAQAKTGVSLKPWEELLEDDQSCWRSSAHAVLALVRE